MIAWIRADYHGLTENARKSPSRVRRAAHAAADNFRSSPGAETGRASRRARPILVSVQVPVSAQAFNTLRRRGTPRIDRMSAIVTRNLGVAARQWANRVSARTLVIPGSHQEPLKEAAKRIGYWGEEQEIDSR